MPTLLRVLTVLLPTALLLGCASSPRPAGEPPKTDRVTQAALTPLGDLNLVKADIPPVLKVALAGPYALPPERDCPALSAHVRQLDEVLGADLDTPATAQNPSLIERGQQAAGDAAVGALRNAAEGVVPFRGWVRRLSGAERYAREVQAAIAAGTVRRAFLKGLGQAAGCAAPAAPAAPSAPAAAVVAR